MAQFMKSFKKNNPIYTRKFFIRVLSSFFLMEFILIFGFAFGYSYFSTKRISGELQDQSLESLEKISSEMDYNFRKYRDIYIYLSHVPDINLLLFSSSNSNYLNMSRGDIVLSQVWNLAPYLHSVFLYNKALDYELWSGSVFVDKEHLMYGDLQSLEGSQHWNMVYSRLLDDWNNFEMRTLSILFTGDDVPGEQGDSGIVITLDREEIEDKLLGKLEGTTILADVTGEIIFQGNPDADIPSDKITEEYIRSVITSSNETDDSDLIISSVKSELTGLYLVNFLDSGAHQKILFQTQVRIILYSVISLLLSLLIALFIAKRLYNPVQKMTELLLDSPYIDPDSKTGEFALITRSYNKVIDHMEELETENQDQNIILKEVFLRRILKTGVVTDLVEKQFRLYDFSVSFPGVVPICIKISEFSDMEENKKVASVKTLKLIINEYLSKDFHIEAVNLFDGEIGALLNWQKQDNNDVPLLKDTLKKIKDIIKSSLDHTVTIGIGQVSESLETCFGCYRNAVDMAKHRFLLGPDSIIDKDMLNESVSYNIDYPQELEDQLIKAIRKNKHDDFVETLGEIFYLFRQCSYSRSVSMLFQLISQCIKTMNIAAQQDSSRYYINMDEFNSIFNTLETLDQVGDWLINIFSEYQHILEKVQTLKSSKYYDLVENIREYIDENFTDQNMNAESIADRAGYSSYYFSKIFRDITGNHIIDYIRQHRIRKAKDLLMGNEHKVSEIPFLVGFSNTSHFYATFKKDVGLTPLDYRNYIQKM